MSFRCAGLFSGAGLRRRAEGVLLCSVRVGGRRFFELWRVVVGRRSVFFLLYFCPRVSIEGFIHC